jgi:hypothetical protein
VETLRINFVGSLPGTSSGDTIVLCSEDDYCRVSSLLRDDLAAAYRAIWVREEHHFSWLKAQLDHCGLSHHRPIAFARTTPSSLLRERWGVEIPDWLSDELIIQAGLLSTALPSGCTNAATGLLAPLLGTLPDAIPQRLAGALAEKLSDPSVQAALGRPILKAAWQPLLDQWASAGSPSWAGTYCKRLGSNPKKLWSDLTAWRLLRRYPEAALDYALDPAAAIFVRDIPADSVQEMSLSQGGRRLALDQIEQIFASAIVGMVTRATFTALLDGVSGELPEEFTAVESLLAHADFDISPSDVAAIEKRFKGCPAISTARFSKLRLYVRPSRPQRVENQSPDASNWVRWAREEYFPYRWWQIERAEFDQEVERSVAAFSEWYCHQFSQVQSDPNLSAIQAISRWRESILKDDVSLILLVDNLPWFFWELLEKALATAGLHRHESNASFVPLPSHTSVCKPLLISGGASTSGSDYLKMLKARSINEWQDRAVHYAGGVDQLAAMAAVSEPCVILLNYLAGDETLHGDAGASGSSWSEQLGLLYKNLAQTVGDFARRVSGSGRDFGLYVLTDHGSTLILSDERRSADALLTQKLFPNEKHRSATLSPAEARLVPENLWKLGHRFVSPFGEGIHFIPSGHNTVASPGSRPIFCHGGATPEEVIVPSGVFRLYSATWTLPRLRFVDLDMTGGRATFYIKRIVSLSVDVQNANGEECRLQLVTISPDIAEVREFDGISVPAHSVSRAKVSLYFGGNATTVSIITLGFIFRIGQDQLVQTIELPVKIISASSGGTDLKSLLS